MIFVYFWFGNVCELKLLVECWVFDFDWMFDMKGIYSNFLFGGVFFVE